jgi:hypothetical protein
MNFRKDSFKIAAILAVPVLLVQAILTKWVYPMFGQVTQNAFSISPTTALNSQVIGDKLIGFISGIIPFNLGSISSWVSIAIGAFLLILAGLFIYEQKWAFKGKNETQRIWAILFYGTVILGVILAATKLAVISTVGLPLLIGLAINYAAIAFVVAFLADKFNFIKV